MIQFDQTEIGGFAPAIRGMRNPKNSWGRSDSIERPNFLGASNDILLGINDLTLAEKLVQGGPVHAKFRRMITVYVDITAPMYWWKEFDTYKIGTVRNSCSTMHTIHKSPITMNDISGEDLFDEDDVAGYVGAKEAMLDILAAANKLRDAYNETKDKKYWRALIQILPSSFNQKATVMLNYEVLANMYKWRRNHKLAEWHGFCDWVESLPYAHTLILGKKFLTCEEDD